MRRGVQRCRPGVASASASGSYAAGCHGCEAVDGRRCLAGRRQGRVSVPVRAGRAFACLPARVGIRDSGMQSTWRDRRRHRLSRHLLRCFRRHHCGSRLATASGCLSAWSTDSAKATGDRRLPTSLSVKAFRCQAMVPRRDRRFRRSRHLGQSWSPTRVRSAEQTDSAACRRPGVTPVAVPASGDCSVGPVTPLSSLPSNTSTPCSGFTKVTSGPAGVERTLTTGSSRASVNDVCRGRERYSNSHAARVHDRDDRAQDRRRPNRPVPPTSRACVSRVRPALGRC